MAIDIMSNDIATRQHKMMGLGVTVTQIDKMMRTSDAALLETIAKGRAFAETQVGARRDTALNMVRAMEIEAGLRNLTA